MLSQLKQTSVYVFIREKYGFILQYFRLKRVAKESLLVQELIDAGDVVSKINSIDAKLLNNEKRVYYIIRRDNGTVGLMTYVSVFLGHIAYAVAKGYIPVIDMQSFASIYLDPKDIGKVNAWELYFKQPCGIGLHQIEKGATCMYSLEHFNPKSPYYTSLFNKDEDNFWKIIANRFIILNDYVRSYVDAEENRFLQNKRILGLLFRGTDYRALKPKHHPIPPSLDEFIEKIKELIKEWGDFDGYYLATEEKEAYLRLDREFPGKIIVNNREYYDDFGDRFLSHASFDRPNDSFLKGLEYLSSIIILSKSSSIIACLCAGTYAGSFFKPSQFDNDFYFYKGIFE